MRASIQVNEAIRLIDTFARELVLREQVPGLSITIVFQDRAWNFSAIEAYSRKHRLYYQKCTLERLLRDGD
jgi:hypothetical protein